MLSYNLLSVLEWFILEGFLVDHLPASHSEFFNYIFTRDTELRSLKMLSLSFYFTAVS